MTIGELIAGLERTAKQVGRDTAVAVVASNGEYRVTRVDHWTVPADTETGVAAVAQIVIERVG